MTNSLNTINLNNTNEMRVVKRDGSLEYLVFDKILNRIKVLGEVSNLQINYQSLAIKVIDQLYDKIPTTKIDELAAEQCAVMSGNHPDYSILASHIVISNHQKNTNASFTQSMELLYKFTDINGKHNPLISEEYWEFVKTNSVILESMIDYKRDFLIDYFGFKTLERAYLFKLNSKVIERPQHMWLRVAIGIHAINSINTMVNGKHLIIQNKLANTTKILNLIKESYDLMSLKYFTHATPTLFNAGTPRSQLSSCYLIAMENDSLDGIFNTLHDCAMISKYAGGIGLHIHNIRAKGTHIQGTNGISNGLVPMLRVFNNTARYVDQCISGETKIKVGNKFIKLGELFTSYNNSNNKNHFTLSNLPINDPKGYSRDWFLTHNETHDPEISNDFLNYNTSEYLDIPKNLYLENNDDIIKSIISHDYNGKIINLTSNLNPNDPIGLTPDHPLLIYDTKNKLISWSSAKDVVVGDLVVYENCSLGVLIDVQHNDYCGKVYDIEMTNYPNIITSAGVIHNGGGRRNGSFAIYLEPWHADIEDFLELRKNHGDEELKARDLFYALWVSDLFMKRVKENADWSLFCPHKCPGLSDVYGNDFVKLYENYELQGLASKTINARELWFKILDAQMETGTPYLLYKDACNEKSNQKNLGVIKSSNLCTEILEYSDANETAVCNLASIALPTFVNKTTKEFDYDKLHQVTKIVTTNLNKVIDINFYPTSKTLVSNLKHRPIGIGVQGLADAFVMMDIAFHSDKALEVNKRIFETIYHGALERSNELSIERKDYIQLTGDYSLLNDYEMANKSTSYCGAYSSFKGSPSSEGKLQFDLWNTEITNENFDWTSLKKSIIKHGLVNSLLVAPMPTASTSQILGFNECFEPFTSNLYTRKTLAGEFVVVNKYLMRDLINEGHWNEAIKNNIIANKGSVQQLDFLPQHIKDKYKIVWEMPMKHIINMASIRGLFICQSQSLNLWVEDPNYNILTSMHFYSWTKGLKTGIYYLRRKAKHQPQQFTIEPENKQSNDNSENNELTETICEMCSA